MPEGPAVGRVEAKRRALTTPSTAPPSNARWCDAWIWAQAGAHLRAIDGRARLRELDEQRRTADDEIRRLLPQLIRAQILSAILGQAIGVLTHTYSLICWTLFYFSTRCEKEGFDLAYLASRVAGAPQPVK